MLRRGLLWGAVAFLTAHNIPWAHSQTGGAPSSPTAPAAGEKVRIHYDAPPECPNLEAFLTEVRSRLGAEWEAAPNELARTIYVIVSRQGPKYLGRIEFVDAREQRITRAIFGEKCETVVEGVALVTVLAIQARVEEALSHSKPVASAAEGPEKPESPGGTKPAAATGTQRRETPSKSPRTSRSPVPTSRKAAAISLHSGARGSVATGIGPSAALGAGLFFGAEIGKVTVRAGFDWRQTGIHTADGLKSRFRLLSGRGDVCPFRVEWAPKLTFFPCASLEVGSLQGEGFNDPPRVVNSKRGSTLWLTPGAELGIALSLSPVFFELQAQGGVPLNQHRFFYATGSGTATAHRVPFYTLGGNIGIGVRF
jgi:hypothetical protein